jgi:hypothetical protein
MVVTGVKSRGLHSHDLLPLNRFIMITLRISAAMSWREQTSFLLFKLKCC